MGARSTSPEEKRNGGRALHCRWACALLLFVLAAACSPHARTTEALVAQVFEAAAEGTALRGAFVPEELARSFGVPRVCRDRWCRFVGVAWVEDGRGAAIVDFDGVESCFVVETGISDGWARVTAAPDLEDVTMALEMGSNVGVPAARGMAPLCAGHDDVLAITDGRALKLRGRGRTADLQLDSNSLVRDLNAWAKTWGEGRPCAGAPAHVSLAVPEELSWDRAGPAAAGMQEAFGGFSFAVKDGARVSCVPVAMQGCGPPEHPTCVEREAWASTRLEGCPGNGITGCGMVYGSMLTSIRPPNPIIKVLPDGRLRARVDLNDRHALEAVSASELTRLLADGDAGPAPLSVVFVSGIEGASTGKVVRLIADLWQRPSGLDRLAVVTVTESWP